MVKIRLQRAGKKKAPFYHIVVADSKSPRDGKIIEQIGTYDPMSDPSVLNLDNEKVEKWIKNVKSKGVQLYIVSNSFSEKTVKKISKELGVKYFYKAAKPSIKGFKKVCDNFPDISKKEILMIGDQLFTDIWGGNRFNINTLLVRRINKKEIWISRIKRPIERIILNHYYKKEENSQKCRV